jgi:hypothetical protein
LLAPFTRTAAAAFAALVVQACQSAPPAQSSLDGYALALPEDQIPALVREDAHPGHMFSYELPASQFQRLETESVDGTGQQYWTDPRIARWQRDTVYQHGAFRIERVSSDNGISGYHAYYGPFRTNLYEWHENGGWRAFRLTELSNVANPDCAADHTTSMRVTGTTAVIVNVNGSDYRLPAYTVDRDYSARMESSEVVLAYVPVLGEFVAWAGKRVGGGHVPRWSGRVLSAQVSDEVLEQVKAAAVR